MVPGSRVWILAPQDAFSKDEDLARVRRTVTDLARSRGLRAEASWREVPFDWQGKALILRYSLARDGVAETGARGEPSARSPGSTAP